MMARRLKLTLRFIVVLLSGCATVIVPAHIELAKLNPGPKTVTIHDTRSPADRVYREVGTTSPTKYFADETLQPSPIALLASRLGESLPERRLADPIELTQLNIGYSVVTKQFGTAGQQPYVPANIPAAAVAIGLLMGYGLVAAAQRAAADETAFVSIAVRIGDKELTSFKSVAINRDRAARVAVEEALADALDAIAAQAKELDAPKAEDPAN
jgi:hypothetical protein